MNRITCFFSDVRAQFVLRLRHLLMTPAFLLVFFLSLICFAFCVRDFSQAAENRSAIPVGLTDRDGTETTKALKNRLKGLPALYVIEGDRWSLLDKMREGELSAVIVIEEGYTQKVTSGKYSKAVTIYEEKGDTIATVIGDMVSAGMLYDICPARGFRIYDKLKIEEELKFSREEYEAYTESLAQDEAFDFGFTYRYVSGNKKEETEPLKNSLFYRQALAALAAMFFSVMQFVLVSEYVTEKSQGLAVRKKVCGMSKNGVICGNLLISAVVAAAFSGVFALCLWGNVREAGIIFSVFFASFLFSVCMAVVYYLLAGLFRTMFFYQLAGAIWLLASSVTGFLYMAEGVLIPMQGAWFDWLPNVRYLQSFTDAVMRIPK